jgi:dihydrofolate reductase
VEDAQLRTCSFGTSNVRLLIYPVVVGQGTRLFPDTGPDIALELVESRSTPKGG